MGAAMISTASTALSRAEGPATLPIPGLYAEQPDAARSLRFNHEKHLAPDLRYCSGSHRGKFDTVLDHWETCFAPDNPPVAVIDDNHLSRFQRWQIEVQEFSPRTANNYVKYVGQILNKLCPRDYRNRGGKGILAQLPYVPMLPVPRVKKRIARFDDLDRFYRECRQATWPQNHGFPAPLWWRTLLVLVFTYALRASDLIPNKTKQGGLRWSSVIWEPECPIAEFDLVSPHGWLVFTPQKTRRIKDELVLPLSETAARHLRHLRDIAPGRDLILPCPTHYAFWKNENARLQRLAGIEQPYTLQEQRKTAVTYWSRIDSELASHVAGHAPRGVTQEHYSNALFVLVKRIEELELPDAYREGP